MHNVFYEICATSFLFAGYSVSAIFNLISDYASQTTENSVVQEISPRSSCIGTFVGHFCTFYSGDRIGYLSVFLRPSDVLSAGGPVFSARGVAEPTCYPLTSYAHSLPSNTCSSPALHILCDGVHCSQRNLPCNAFVCSSEADFKKICVCLVFEGWLFHIACRTVKPTDDDRVTDAKRKRQARREHNKLRGGERRTSMCLKSR